MEQLMKQNNKTLNSASKTIKNMCGTAETKTIILLVTSTWPLTATLQDFRQFKQLIQ